MCSRLNGRERAFVAISWLPKATVQAALGPVTLETVRQLGLGQDVEQIATNILTLAALAILITAPIGTLAMQLSGPRLLRRENLSVQPVDL